jgi:hypothetical protein
MLFASLLLRSQHNFQTLAIYIAMMNMGMYTLDHHQHQHHRAPTLCGEASSTEPSNKGVLNASSLSYSTCEPMEMDPLEAHTASSISIRVQPETSNYHSTITSSLTSMSRGEPARGVKKTRSLRRGAAGYNELLQSAVTASIESRAEATAARSSSPTEVATAEAIAAILLPLSPPTSSSISTSRNKRTRQDEFQEEEQHLQVVLAAQLLG